MATVTNLISGGTASTSNASSYASASHTPPGNEVLFYFVAASGTQAAAPTLTASANGMTFTLVTSARANTNANRLYCFVSDQLTPATPAAMTVTFDCTGDSATGAVISGCAVDVTKTGTAAVKQSAIHENGASATADTVTLAAACDTNNPVLSALISTVTSGTGPPAGFTEQVDASYSTPATGGAYRSVNSGFTGTTITGTDSSIGLWGTIAIEVDASSSSLNADLTPATETDTAVTLARRKSRSLTPATETDTALTVTRFIPPQTANLTPATETDSTVPLGRRKSRSLAPAVETDTALLSRVKSKGLTPATETDTALTVPPFHARTLTPAVETDAAFPVTRQGGGALTPASETDSAATLARVKSRPLTPAGQTDAAISLARRKSRTLTPATEADEAVPISKAGGHTLTPTVEADAAVTLTRLKSKSILPATETDTAVTVTRRIFRSLNPATESDTGVGIRRLVTANLTPATETDVVVHLAPQKARLLGPAGETDSAVTITRRKILALVAVGETDNAFPVVQLLPFIPAAHPVVVVIGGQRGDITGIGDRDSTVIGGKRGSITGIGDRGTSVTTGGRDADIEPREVGP